jgi:hypothetical protein
MQNRWRFARPKIKSETNGAMRPAYEKEKNMSTHIQFTQPALLISIVRLNNSRNGNPSYMLGFADGLTGFTYTGKIFDTMLGEYVLLGKTKKDAGFAYAIHDGMSYVTVKYHFTPKGKCIIDDVTERGE